MNAADLAAAPHYVYRLIGEDEALLYVGCSVDPAARLASHRIDRPWSDLIARQDVEGPFSRCDALAREARAISTERPRFNVAHNPMPERWAGPSEEAFLFVQRRVSVSGRELMRAFWRGDIPMEPTEADVWLWLKSLDVHNHAYPCYRSCRCGTYWSHAFALAEEYRMAEIRRLQLSRAVA